MINGLLQGWAENGGLDLGPVIIDTIGFSPMYMWVNLVNLRSLVNS